MNLRRRAPEEPDFFIDLAPLIDVVFILLIFFMVSTTFNRESELEIQLPEASPGTRGEEPRKIEISIDAAGHYFLNEKALINDQLETLKRALLKELDPKASEAPPVVLLADAQTPHQAVIRAMDAARQAGLSRLSFATRGEPGGE